MKVQVRQDGPCQVVSIQGSADVSASAVLRNALLGALDAGATRIVCDLSKTDFICSDALGVLITAYLKAHGRGGFVRLANPQKRLRELLETTRLDHLFDIHPDVASAVKNA
jgi:anti-sigma B factor antagonist